MQELNLPELKINSENKWSNLVEQGKTSLSCQNKNVVVKGRTSLMFQKQQKQPNNQQETKNLKRLNDRGMDR